MEKSVKMKQHKFLNRRRKTESNKLSIAESFKKYKSLYIIMFITMAYYFVFHYIPIFMGVTISLKELKIGGSIMNAPWVGFENYKYVFSNPDVINVILNTLEISLMRLLWGFWPPIILAIAIFDIMNATYKKICQTIVYVPHFFSWVIVYGIVFAFFSSNGMVNIGIKKLGFESIDFLTSKEWFRPVLVGSQIWKTMGWGTILYFAALTNVDPQLYEAAKMDGAGPLNRIKIITLPAILPIIVFNLILALGNILNNDFEQILMFYNAAVYDVADIIESWVYRVGIGKMQYGIGSAVSILKAGVSLTLIVTCNKTAKKLVGRSLW